MLTAESSKITRLLFARMGSCYSLTTTFFYLIKLYNWQANAHEKNKKTSMESQTRKRFVLLKQQLNNNNSQLLLLLS